jgi:hypothetical protein
MDFSIQFHISELKIPVNLLINRAFFNVVVMGTIELDLYLFDYQLLFDLSPKQLPPRMPPVIAAVGGH